MASLGDIPAVRNNIKAASTSITKKLHKIIFGTEGDRNNRGRLREFSGFNLEKESEEYKKVLESIKGTISMGDSIAIANLLLLDYNKQKDLLINDICDALNDLKLIKNSEVSEAEDEDYDFNECERENQNVNTENAAIHNDQLSEASSVGSSASTHVNNNFSMSFRDVEDSIVKFEGNGTYPINKWIMDMEDMSKLLSWTQLQLFIFAKKSIIGLAKIYIQSEPYIRSWNDLKKALTEEFGCKMNSIQLHKQLSDRKIKNGESVQEYFLLMKELSCRGNIEEAALIQYVIDGLIGDFTNKLILYGAKDLKEFKQKLKLYSEIQQTKSRAISTPKQNFPNNSEQNKRPNNQESISRKIIRCFNCGMQGHNSTECRSKSLGAKCFKCNIFGHKSFECPNRNTPHKSGDNRNKEATNAINKVDVIMKNKMHKDLFINGIQYGSLIDTGSQANLIQESAFKNIDCSLEKSTILLTGFGKASIKTLGQFKTKLVIDNNIFETNLHVVPDYVMETNLILGSPFLENVEVLINSNGLTIKKLTEDDNVAEEVKIMSIECQDVKEIEFDPNVNKEIKKEVMTMVQNYKPNKMKTTNIQMKITLTEEKPIYCTPRRLPYVEKEIVDRQVEEWIEEGIVEPCTSEWASPVVLTKRKNGSHRICIDFRKINRITCKDRYPLPLIEEQLDKLQDAKVFSSIDLRNGFFHVDVAAESRKFTSFVTHRGQFQFLKVPFGFCNSPAVFQRFINTVFKPLMNLEFVMPYMDDLIITASNEQENLERLRLVFNLAQDYGLEINFKKCQFVKRRIEFLGHVIENGQIFPSPGKIEAVKKFPQPTTVKQVQSFLGLSGYFRKFIANYSIIAKPLSDLLKKDSKFKFQQKELNAFENLKVILSQEPLLTIFQRDADIELHTDASQDGFGAVLLQKSKLDNQLHPTYYFSRKTSDAQKKYSSYELEVLAIIESLKKFRVYLLGAKFKIVTDCAAFQKTMEKKDLTTRVARWALLLEDYDYSIEHRAGSRMRHVDALSRNPIMLIELTLRHEIKRAQDQDEEIKTIKELLKEKPYNNYFIKDEVLYRHEDGIDLLVVPRCMQLHIIKQAHENGHFASRKIEHELKNQYYIPKLKSKIDGYISTCVPCILSNRKTGKQESFLHPIEKESVPLHTYHVDHLGPLETTNKNYKHLFVVIDAFTKFVWIYPTKTTATKEVISKLELQKCVFGNPVVLISDRGTAFTSNDFEDYCKQENIKHVLITTGLARSNGQVECINKIIISVLSKLSMEDPTKWYKHVSQLQITINSSYQRSINTTPFQLMIGVKMNHRLNIDIVKMIEEETKAEFEAIREELRVEAKKSIIKNQEENRHTYNLRRKKPRKYAVGDLVAIKRTQFGPGLKLKPKYLGPYEIRKCKTNDSYDVEKKGIHEGPYHTTTCAEYLKPWIACEPDGNSDNDQDD